MIIGKTVLYSTGCPKCKILKKKLDEKSIEYSEVNDVDAMLALNIDAVPVLIDGNNRMDFKEALDWVKINERK